MGKSRFIGMRAQNVDSFAQLLQPAPDLIWYMALRLGKLGKHGAPLPQCFSSILQFYNST